MRAVGKERCIKKLRCLFPGLGKGLTMEQVEKSKFRTMHALFDKPET